MTVYDIPNIENCDVVAMVNGKMFKIITHEGWVISLPYYEENNYTTAVILQDSFDFSVVQILNINELPEGYIIDGVTEDGEEEILQDEITDEVEAI